MFHTYPYTDFHELNLDWFLSEFKKLRKTVDLLLANTDKRDYAYSGSIINVNKIGRYAHRLYVYGADYQDPTTYPTGMEGFCVVGNNYVMLFKSSNDSLGEIIVLDSDFKIIRRSGYFENLGHANSMCYANGMLYIATLDNTIISINYDTLTYNATYTYSNNVHAIAYDAVKKEIVWSDYDYIYDLAGGVICNISGVNINTAQGMAAYNGFYYLLQSASSTILKFDNTGELLDAVAVNTGELWEGELQDMDIDADGILYVNGSTRYTRYQYNFSSVYSGNINGTTEQADIVLTNLANYKRTVYVDRNNYQSNPDGSANKPFNYIEEALLYAISQPKYYGTTQLHLVSGSDFSDEVLFIGNMFIDIIGNDCPVKFIEVLDSSVSLHNIRVINDDTRYRSLFCNSARGTLNNINITQSDYTGDYDAHLYESNLLVNAITGANSLTAEMSSIKCNDETTYKTITWINSNPIGFLNGHSFAISTWGNYRTTDPISVNETLESNYLYLIISGGGTVQGYSYTVIPGDMIRSTEASKRIPVVDNSDNISYVMVSGGTDSISISNIPTSGIKFGIRSIRKINTIA